MRTATPLATCAVMTDAGPSATSAAISTPRFIGPGCMTRASGCRRAARSRSARSGPCTRAATGTASVLALALEAQQVDDVEVGEHVVEVVRDLDRPALERRGQQRRRADQRHVGARGRRRRSRRAAATRLWRMSPTMATRAPSRPVPRWRRQGVAVEQRLGRVLVPAVAGVDHRLACTQLATRPGTPADGVAHDDGVDAHRFDRLDRVAQALALLDRRAADRRTPSCRRRGAWPPSRTTAASASSPRRTATRPSCRAAPAPSGCRGASPRRTLGRGRGAPRCRRGPGRRPTSRSCISVALPRRWPAPRARCRRPRRPPRRAGPARPRRASSAGSCRRSRGGSAARGAPGRPSPRAGPRGAGPVGERVERGADRPPGEQHVVDEHDRVAGEVDGDLGRAERQHRPQAMSSR